MKQISSKLKRHIPFILAFVVIIFASSNVFAQPFERLREARKLYSEGIDIIKEGNVEEYKKALANFREAERLFEGSNDRRAAAFAQFEVAMTLHKLGRLGEALKIYLDVFPKFHKFNLEVKEAETLNVIGVIYRYLGQPKAALNAYNSALRIYYEQDKFEDSINTLNNIGNIHKNLGNKEDARFYFELSLPHLRLTQRKSDEAMVLRNLGSLYIKFREYDRAESYLKDSLEFLRETGFEHGEIRVLNTISVVAFRLGKTQEAVNYSYQALQVNRSRFLEDEATTLSQLQSILNLTGKKRLAIFYGKQAVNNYQKIRRSIRSLDTDLQSSFLTTIESDYRELADLLIEQGDFARAEQVLRMLKEAEFFDFVRRDLGETNNFKHRVRYTEKEKALITRYTDLSNRISGLEREKQILNKRKKNLSAEEQKRFKELNIQLESAKLKFQNLLSKEFVAAFGKNVRESIEYDRSLQAKLKEWGEGTVTLYTVVAENRYRVILTTPNKQIAAKTEISTADLNKKIFAYRDALQDIDIDPRPLGKELYDILIKPIEKDLQAANAKTLVWSLDGTLRYIPIATLSPDGKSYLVEQYRNVIITPKTRDDVSDLDEEWLALGVGVSEPQTVTNPENPQEEIDFVAIPGTKQELTTIIRDEANKDEKGILNGRRYIDKDFTLNSLTESLNTKNSKGKRKFTAVHIASHFQLGSNWSNSFLLLGNGKILTLEELKNSPKLDFGNVELITLSACDTAFTADSNGKEVDSLATVIQAKSGKAVLAALWAVADESTPLLMSEFYRVRQENPKMTKAEAMQKVQKAFVSGKLKPSAEYTKKLADYYKAISPTKNGFKFENDAPFSHPYFWSPFVLIGNWR